MYNLPYFKEESQEVILDFIKDNPFAFLSGCDANNKPVATQVPVFIEEGGGKQFLRGHIMRNTDHHKAFLKNPNALVVFTGQHCYVSATWYGDPHQASTWNYMSVHVKGIMRFLDEQGLIEVLRKTTLYFENNDSSSTTVFDNLSPDYTGKLMQAIVAFEIDISSIENVFKLSQNRDRQSYENIIGHLNEGDAAAKTIAHEMAKRASHIFPPQTGF